MPPCDTAGMCLLCGSPGTKVLFSASDRLYGTTNKPFQVVKCSGCGFARLSPAPSAEELDSYYPEHYWFEPDDSATGRLEERYRRLLVRDHVRFAARALVDSGETGPLLDVGCGGGLFLGILRERGAAVLGLDRSPDAASLAWRRHGVPAVCGDLVSAPFPRESCAAITMFHVLEHLPDPKAHLRAAHALLRPNGRLIVQVPNIACWQFALLGASWNGVDVPRHLYNFRPADLAAMLESCGFTVLRRKQFSWRDNPAGLATSVAPELEPVARRVRATGEGSFSKLAKDAVYFALVLAAVPFTLTEAAFGAGSTVMMEARKSA
ncbi:MAG: class I SAM-dependent methyltransferase [Acidobacteriota bacterium]|nr:class I SAM-dependent methyltransferase [Acidobacteriota bacterium]